MGKSFGKPLSAAAVSSPSSPTTSPSSPSPAAPSMPWISSPAASYGLTTSKAVATAWDASPSPGLSSGTGPHTRSDQDTDTASGATTPDRRRLVPHAQTAPRAPNCQLPTAYCLLPTSHHHAPPLLPSLLLFSAPPRRPGLAPVPRTVLQCHRPRRGHSREMEQNRQRRLECQPARQGLVLPRPERRQTLPHHRRGPGTDQDAAGPRSLRALCLDPETGKVLWNTEVFTESAKTPAIHSKNSHASPTPVAGGRAALRPLRARRHRLPGLVRKKTLGAAQPGLPTRAWRRGFARAGGRAAGLSLRWRGRPLPRRPESQ